MNSPEERIAQFENMATADPDNEMAHFSLGNAYLQAGRAAEAAVSFERCIELNPEMSKAYQLAGESLIKAGWSDRAVEVLNTGYVIAARRGEQLPRQAMDQLFEELRQAPTLDEEVEAEAARRRRRAPSPASDGTGRDATRGPPRPVGEWIQANIAAETWRMDRTGHEGDQRTAAGPRRRVQPHYDQHMNEFLGFPPNSAGRDHQLPILRL